MVAVVEAAGSSVNTSTSVISLEEFADHLEASEIVERTDIGLVIIYKAIHPNLNNIILINTAGESNALIKL